MKATQLRDPFRNTLLSTAKKNKAWLATRDAVVAKREGLDPYFSIENALATDLHLDAVPGLTH